MNEQLFNEFLPESNNFNKPRKLNLIANYRTGETLICDRWNLCYTQNCLEFKCYQLLQSCIVDCTI